VTSADDGSEHHLHLLRAGLYRLHPASATACVHVYPWPVAAVGRTVVACPDQRPRPSRVTQHAPLPRELEQQRGAMLACHQRNLVPVPCILLSLIKHSQVQMLSKTCTPANRYTMLGWATAAQETPTLLLPSPSFDRHVSSCLVPGGR
jgi:hypothetical protein